MGVWEGAPAPWEGTAPTPHYNTLPLPNNNSTGRFFYDRNDFFLNLFYSYIFHYKNIIFWENTYIVKLWTFIIRIYIHCWFYTFFQSFKEIIYFATLKVKVIVTVKSSGCPQIGLQLLIIDFILTPPEKMWGYAYTFSTEQSTVLTENIVILTLLSLCLAYLWSLFYTFLYFFLYLLIPF